MSEKQMPASQSAEEFAVKLQEFAKNVDIPKPKSMADAIDWYEKTSKQERDEWVKLIESDRAAQRQAGREEAHALHRASYAMAQAREGLLRERYAAVVEAASELTADGSMSWEEVSQAINKISKALSDLDEARKG